MDDPLKIGLYILLFLPGYILVQTRDYHLLREKKPQFEKTLEVVLWSAIIWLIACIFPLWPWSAARKETIDSIVSAVENRKEISSDVGAAYKFLSSTLITAFIVANVWGYVRKSPYVDAIISYLTGRDWYPSGEYKFFLKNIKKPIKLTLQNNTYMGILYSAPDNKDDKYIILKEVFWVPPANTEKKEPAEIKEPIRLKLEYLLVKYDEILEIQALPDDVIKQKSEHPASGKAKICWNKFKSLWEKIKGRRIENA